jgi:hypothetical protein
MEVHVRIGAMNDGRIRGIDLYTLSNTGAYGEHGPTTVGLSGHKSIPLYNKFQEAYRFTYDVVYTNVQAAGAYRGYGATQGRPHRNRPVSALCRVEREPAPDWFWRGVEAAMLAPTAVNRQQFCVIWTGETVKAQATAGGLAHLDLGIVKYHFEIGADNTDFDWA